jgi:NTE family protein
MTKHESADTNQAQSSKSVPAHAVTSGIGLALGGGGARGLAHVVMLEAFDDLGIKPAIISGTSIGAMYGAAYASGMSGKELRRHTKEMLSLRFGLMRDLFSARSQPLQRMLNPFGSRTALLDPLALLDIVMPKTVKATFEELEIPLKVVASDFYDQEPTIFSEGPLRPAVAASMALPAIFQPMIANGRAMVDGGLTNPLPFDLLTNDARIVVAIDVSGAPVPDPKRPWPTALEALFASAFLFENSIVREKLKAQQPDILIRAGTSRYQVLDFLKVDEILAAAEPAKEKLKAQLDRVMSVETLPHIDHAEPIALLEREAAKPRRRLLPRRRKSKAK